MSTLDRQILIGADGGGSGCRVAVGTRDGILATATGGPANFASNPVQVIETLKETVHEAARQADVDIALAQAHIGLAGVMSAADAARIAQALPFQATVTDDRPTTLAGALQGDGYLLAIGTGSFVAASTGGQHRFIGGWGFCIGDQASGARLGHAALEHTLLAYDGVRPHTTLTRSLLAEFEREPAKITAFSLTATPADYAQFAPQITRSDDPLAHDLMTQGADYLTRSLTALGFRPGDPLCLTGGLGPAYRPYLPQAAFQDPKGTALDGAFHLARQALDSP